MERIPVIELFFELIRTAIGTGKGLSTAPTAQEWEELLELSKKQALLGITFTGIEKLPDGQRPPKGTLLVWYNYCKHIEAANEKLNKQATAVAEKFLAEGFRNAIIKGQGLATIYDNPLRRTPGDIDIWLDGERDEIISYVKKIVPGCKPVYHHVDFPLFPDIDIEIHFMPSWMYNYFTNRKLLEYFASEKEAQFTNSIALHGCTGCINVPTNSFNRIFILLHIYRHLFEEGIGLRQLLDYYYVLQQGFTKQEKAATLQQLKELKMVRFAGAVMHVLKKVFAMDEKYFLTTPLEKEGDFLLNEILAGGNFGKYSQRYEAEMNGNLLQRAFARTTHNMIFARSYPSEILAAQPFRIWHYFWRKKYNR